ncbi:MAG: aconitate hydratase AcnA [Pelagibacteraceae bacterium]|nr:aconitate hydratase AcnA [Pelagibacteraceae bacterium]|tara:strand:- start:820 stop:3444 length:2625 start_codon:yes stop_codon:yes gene_type:complete
MNSFGTLDEIKINNGIYVFHNLSKIEEKFKKISSLPKSKKILIENLLRLEDGINITKDLLHKVLENPNKNHEIFFLPARVLMQDFTGVPAIADLAAMRNAVAHQGKNPDIVNPLSQVDLVIDHSVMVDYFATPDSFKKNVEMEFGRNKERYEFLKWGQEAFENFRVVPPGTGICHQVNLEYLAKVVWTKSINNKNYIYPDTLVGTDSHTTMVNALGVLGWGVGGIEAEAAMLGQPVSMLMPDVLGFNISNSLSEGVTATDLVLKVVEMLREKGVVGKFVEFYGDGLKNLSLADRATIANMAPEYGATCGFFAVDDETIKYLDLTARGEKQIELIKEYSIIQGLWQDNKSEYKDSLSLDLKTIKASLAGPKRPQDRIDLDRVKNNFHDFIAKDFKSTVVENKTYKVSDGSVVIAAITSCTNTSNPNVLIAAGLVAQKATELGLDVKPWVKTSLAPGSKVVTEYLNNAGLNKYLDKLGFHLVGYGCTTCIGNSGPLDQDISNTISNEGLSVASVLSGNRNFEGRVNPYVKANYLASPPLVVAYALAGTVNINMLDEPLGKSLDGNDIYLKDIWPTNSEINEIVDRHVTQKIFNDEYQNILEGTDEWKIIKTIDSELYDWDDQSTYVKKPPFFDHFNGKNKPITSIEKARPLMLLGDSITTDHISPAGAIKKESPAGNYFMEKQILNKDFNSYGARRGNHEVMMRGTFANIRIKNKFLNGKEGGYSILQPENKEMSVYEVAMTYKQRGEDMVIFAGKEYGTGSSRDWAAKGTKLLGIKAVIAESFERIHRSNLIGMGILPIQLNKKLNTNELNISSTDLVSISLDNNIKPLQNIKVKLEQSNKEVTLDCILRIDTLNELEYYKSDGILNFVLKGILN